MEKIITYFGKAAFVSCDEKCNKAWGHNNRPRVYMGCPKGKIFELGEYPNTDDENFDYDDYAYLSDDELGEAPADPGTYEGGDSKPTNESEKMNKWCIRECERCVFSQQYPLPNKDFSVRNYNIPR